MYDTRAKPSDEEQLLGEDLPFIPKTFSSGPNRLQLIDEYMRFLDKGDGEEKTHHERPLRRPDRAELREFRQEDTAEGDAAARV